MEKLSGELIPDEQLKSNPETLQFFLMQIGKINSSRISKDAVKQQNININNPTGSKEKYRKRQRCRY